MKEIRKYIGLDVHKETIAVSIADAGRPNAPFHGTIRHTTSAVSSLLKKINPDGGVLELCYEPEPCGRGLHRQLLSIGRQCSKLVAPTLIPQRA